ncbi:hypothetical protein SAMN05444673_3971 [Bacillus sp. OV166]|uniref:hypothetical protein n=1 Tax=Bacillus sp. OV166 TaxID=1882763 RepID=UPI000A2AEA26|nr:hypothetical protein [Bacillus sp. OV166]SMQ80664.1 hypothetical protein SAMN05444673_3971 [Bacillus sp. OV166]
MSIKIDSELISLFRKEVYIGFFSEKFKNVKGKNHWNIICSAMDWITLAADGLPLINVDPKGFGYNHLDTLNLMQYIITIDVMVESINQLFRVIEGINKDKDLPLANDRTIFNQTKVSDYNYFKHIRAVFSTHPVNLTSLDGAPSNNGEKFYASWVAKNSLDGDYYVYLYSNNPEKDELIPFDIKIRDLNLYAERRYKLLDILIDKIKTIKDKHINQYKQSPIHIFINPIEQLEVLYEENKKRFGYRYGYVEEINHIYIQLKISTTSISGTYFEGIISEYRSYLNSLIPIILYGLQNMVKDRYLLLDIMFWKGYEFEKIYQYFNDGVHQLGKEYLTELAKVKPFPAILATTEDIDLKRLIVDAFLHKEFKKIGKSISFLEIIKPTKGNV